MKQRRFTAWFLMLVSIVMLTASTLPHHHHFGRICLQQDLTECTSCCASSSQNSEKGTSCKVCCVTKFKCSTPDNRDDVQPHFTQVIVLFTEAIISELFTPDEQTHQYNSYYFDSLHSIRITHSIGLRAPPCMA